MKHALACLIAMFAAACSPQIQPVVQETEERAGPVQAGVYVFDTEPGAPVACVMKLDDDIVEDAPGFHSVWLGPGCERAFPELTTLTGWHEAEDGAFRLVGYEDSTFGAFVRGGDGVLRAESSGRIYTMVLGE